MSDSMHACMYVCTAAGLYDSLFVDLSIRDYCCASANPHATGTDYADAGVPVNLTKAMFVCEPTRSSYTTLVDAPTPGKVRLRCVRCAHRPTPSYTTIKLTHTKMATTRGNDIVIQSLALAYMRSMS